MPCCPFSVRKPFKRDPFDQLESSPFDQHAEVLRSCKKQSWRATRASIVAKTACLSCARRGLPSLCAETLAAQGSAAADQRSVAASRCMCIPCPGQPFLCVLLSTLQAACFASLTLSEKASKPQKQLQQPLPVGTLRGGLAAQQPSWTTCSGCGTRTAHTKPESTAMLLSTLLRRLFLQAIRLYAISGMATRSRLSTLRTC